MAGSAARLAEVSRPFAKFSMPGVFDSRAAGAAVSLADIWPAHTMADSGHGAS
jgi:hypothetical protein